MSTPAGPAGEGRTTALAAATIAVLSLALYGGIRLADLRAPGRGAENLEATYHVLLTVTALDQSPPSSHWYLPTVTLGRASDKHIPWGATVPTSSGDYIYTSFYSVGFLVPFLAFKATGTAPGLASIVMLNLWLHLLFVGILCGLTYRVSGQLHRDNGTRLLMVAAAAAVALLAKESLQTWSVVYWGHSVSQLFLTLQLWFAIEHFLAPSARSTRWLGPLAAATLLAALTEWTGFVSAILLAAAFLVQSRRTRDPAHVRAAVVLAAAAMVAGIVIVVHYGMAVGLPETLKALASRSLARGPDPRNLLKLPVGYAESFGLLLLVVPVAAWLTHRPEDQGPRWIAGVVILAAALPVLENLLMLQHATQFSYDRAKAVVPLALAAGVAMAALRTRGRLWLGASLAVALLQNVATYEEVNRRHAGWPAIDNRNRELIAKAGSLVHEECSFVASSSTVRAYLNLLVARGVHENRSWADSDRLGRRPGKCGAVWIETEKTWSDLPSIRRIVLSDLSGLRVVQ